MELLTCADAGSSLIANAGFEQRGGTNALPTSITSWTSDTAVIGDGSDFEFDETNIYHPATNANDTRRALNVKLTRTLTQRLDLTGRTLPHGIPLYYQIAYNRTVGSASGTLALHIGTQSVSVAVSAQSGWQTLVLTVDENCFPANMYEDQLDAKIVWTRTGGEVLLDDIILVPMTLIGNEWLYAVGGQTPFEASTPDKWTWTNSEVGAVNQRWLWRAYDVSWPSASSPTVTDA